MAAVLALACLEPLAQAGEETVGPLSQTTTLKWRVRGSQAKPASRQPVRPVANLQPADSDSPAAAPAVGTMRVVSADDISSRKTRSRLRDSIMQVDSRQPSDTQPPAKVNSSEDSFKDPFADDTAPPATPAAQGPAPVPPDNTARPPAMPDDVPAATGPKSLPASQPSSQRETFEPADDLFKDQPIPEDKDVRQFELPRAERDQLLEGDLSIGPGEPGCGPLHRQDCQDALRSLQKRDITTITVGLLIEGVEGTDYPCDCRIGRDLDAPQFAGRNFSPTLFTWKAASTCHKPLYFEDVQLERYGHSWNPVLQPFISGAHFFVSVPLLPYKMGLKTPNECVYTLGYYRPGSCAPYMFEPIPLSLRGAVYEAFGATAFAFWFWPPN